jgi:hypothetical protein
VVVAEEEEEPSYRSIRKLVMRRRDRMTIVAGVADEEATGEEAAQQIL